MKSIEQYHLHKDQPTKLHFEAHRIEDYLSKSGKPAFYPHRHSYYQLLWFKTPGQHYIDYQTFEHPENSVFFIDKGQIHYFCLESANEGYLFHFNDEFLHQNEFNYDDWSHYRIFHELSQPFLPLSADLLQQVTQINELLHEELDRKDYNYQQQVYFLFRLILLKIERLKRRENQELIETRGEFDSVARFRQMVDHTLNEMYSVEYYAYELGISSKKLTQLVNKYLGETPAQVINQQKAVEAKRLLSNTNLSIKEVAYKLGFNQATYFTKFFKKHTDVTPKEFRKLLEDESFLRYQTIAIK